MKLMFPAALMLTAAAAVAVVAQAAQPPSATPPSAMPPSSVPPSSRPMSQSGPGASPATKAFQAANEKMMHDMMAPMSGDADRDFVAGMLPHHQGAVDMARVELQYGKDPAMRRLAAAIVRSQQQEIAEMTAWQVRHAAPH